MTLPDDGPVSLGAIRLPEGRPIKAVEGSVQVAWVTSEPVPNPGRLWLATSRLAGETGLRPLLIRTDYDGARRFRGELSEEDALGFLGFLPELMPRSEIVEGFAAVASIDEPLLPEIQLAIARRSRPGDVGDGFLRPGNVARIDRIDPHDTLRDRWFGVDGGDEEYLTAGLHPFTGTFPGLAPAMETSLPEEMIVAALDQFEAAHLGLVVADRPADIITVSGWGPTDAWQDLESLSAVLRSWEDRFGARLIQVGPGAQIRLLVERPPRMLAEALPVAVELYAFGEKWFSEAGNDRNGINEIREIVPLLLSAPIWGFWWD